MVSTGCDLCVKFTMKAEKRWLGREPVCRCSLADLSRPTRRPSARGAPCERCPRIKLDSPRLDAVVIVRAGSDTPGPGRCTASEFVVVVVVYVVVVVVVVVGVKTDSRLLRSLVVSSLGIQPAAALATRKTPHEPQAKPANGRCTQPSVVPVAVLGARRMNK